MYPSRVWMLFLFCGVLAPPVLAQPSSPQLAAGWSALARGETEVAAGAARQVLAGEPLNVAAAALLVEAELARDGGSGALVAYERWLGGRRVDAPYLLRRVAAGTLRQMSQGPSGSMARVRALQALAADGDQAAAAQLAKAVNTRGFAEASALAELGEDEGVKALIAQLAAMPGGKAPIIDALGRSRNALAIPPLRALLTDPMDINRAAAADALGRLGAMEAIPALREMLKDSVFTVRLKAAGALLRLGDAGGIPLLTELTLSEHSGVRSAAARELSAQPDVAWQQLVRSLATDPDPVVRLDAARMIAPYDPALARQVLDDLMQHDNLAIREAAAGALVDRVASDFATLRRLLHSPDPMTRVGAAARILELTR